MIATFWLFQAAAATQLASPYDWPRLKTQWSEADERGYGRFIAAIAASNCHTVVTCLSAPANPLARNDPPGLTFSADCADLVYMLRAYYAWKHGIPFGFTLSLEARDPRDAGDLRFSKGGNRPKARWDVTVGPSADIRQVLDTIRNAVSTATFRIDPRLGDGAGQDFYSPKITRAALRPGSAVYNGDGHVVILTGIDSAGRIHFMDAHPDFTVTRGIVSSQFQPGDPAIAAGFHAWRPVAMQDGALKSPRNDTLPDFSMVQYLGPGANVDWTRADFTEGGRNIDFVEFTRRRLAKRRLVYDIRDETKLGLDGLCDEIADRRRAVDEAVSAGMARRDRPGRLEGTGYEEGALWFAYSTPGRDKRLRMDVVRLAAHIDRMVQLYRRGTREVHYRGRSLKASLRGILRHAAKACTVTYRNGQGAPVTRSLGLILERLPELSFDPYNCIERRWGAAGDELASCAEPDLKRRWYEAEAPLRRIPPADRPPNATLDELSRVVGTGDLVTGETLRRAIDRAPSGHRRRHKPGRH